MEAARMLNMLPKEDEEANLMYLQHPHVRHHVHKLSFQTTLQTRPCTQ